MNGRRESEKQSRLARLRPEMPVLYSQLPAPSFAAEQLRTLAFQVDEAAQRAAGGGFALAVTSPDPGAGKTLTSLNLALTLAQEGERRVLIVEADLWKPTLGRYLELEDPEPGLCQLLEDGGSLKDATVPIWGAGLDLLPAGAQGRVGNLLGQRRMSELLDEMRRQYEIVVLDSPPFVLASGRAVASAADGTLLIVRAGRTKKKGIEEVLATLGPQKVVGLALNGTRSRNGRGYAYYAYDSPPEKRVEREEPVALDADEGEDDEDLILAAAASGERRRRQLLLAGGALLVALVALGIYSLRPGQRPDSAAAPVEPETAAAQTDLAADAAEDLQRVLGERIVEGARLAVAEEPAFDDSYVSIEFPGGDPGRDRGSGADLVVRAFRHAGIDLQQLVHEDIGRAAGDYGITVRDPSIDHRRARNLAVFFRRNAITVPPELADWRPGDVVIWVTNRLEIPERIGIVSDRLAGDSQPMVLYHFRADGTFSGKPGEGDILSLWPIGGHFRWSLDSPAPPPVEAPEAAASAEPAAEPEPTVESAADEAPETAPIAEPAAEPEPTVESAADEAPETAPIAEPTAEPEPTVESAAGEAPEAAPSAEPAAEPAAEPSPPPAESGDGEGSGG